jgi:hypothetical protein
MRDKNGGGEPIKLYCKHICKWYANVTKFPVQLSYASFRKERINLVWWYMPTIPALEKLRQEDHEFESSPGYIVNSRTTWAIEQDPISKKKKKPKRKKMKARQREENKSDKN